MSYFMREVVRARLWPNQQYSNSVCSKVAEFVAEIGSYHEKQLGRILEIADDELEPTVVHLCEILFDDWPCWEFILIILTLIEKSAAEKTPSVGDQEKIIHYFDHLTRNFIKNNSWMNFRFRFKLENTWIERQILKRIYATLHKKKVESI